MPPARPAAPPVSPAVAARVRQLAAQAEHRRAIAEFRAHHAADQQARADALLLEAIAALASLFNQPDRTGSHPAWPSRSPTSEPPTPSTPRPAITCTLSTAGSCANSVAANTGSVPLSVGYQGVGMRPGGRCRCYCSNGSFDPRGWWGTSDLAVSGHSLGTLVRVSYGGRRLRGCDSAVDGKLVPCRR